MRPRQSVALQLVERAVRRLACTAVRGSGGSCGHDRAWPSTGSEKVHAKCAQVAPSTTTAYARRPRMIRGNTCAPSLGSTGAGSTGAVSTIAVFPAAQKQTLLCGKKRPASRQRRKRLANSCWAASAALECRFESIALPQERTDAENSPAIKLTQCGLPQ